MLAGLVAASSLQQATKENDDKTQEVLSNATLAVKEIPEAVEQKHDQQQQQKNNKKKQLEEQIVIEATKKAEISPIENNENNSKLDSGWQ